VKYNPCRSATIGRASLSKPWRPLSAATYEGFRFYVPALRATVSLRGTAGGPHLGLPGLLSENAIEAVADSPPNQAAARPAAFTP